MEIDNRPPDEAEIRAARDAYETAYEAGVERIGFFEEIGANPADCRNAARKILAILESLTDAQHDVLRVFHGETKAYGEEWDLEQPYRDLIKAAEGEGGRPPIYPGFEEAVLSLWVSWLARGNSPMLGQPRPGDGRAWRPYPLLIFMADALERIMRHLDNPPSRREDLESKIHNRLDALKRARLLPGMDTENPRRKRR